MNDLLMQRKILKEQQKIAKYRLLTKKYLEFYIKNCEKYNVMQDMSTFELDAIKFFRSEKVKFNLLQLAMLGSALETYIKQRTTYKEAMNNYKSVIDSYHKLALELQLDEAIDLANFAAILLWNGYFSYSGSEIYSYKNRITTDGNPFHIVNGSGVCRDYSIILDDYLNSFDIHCGSISGYAEINSPNNSANENNKEANNNPAQKENNSKRLNVNKTCDDSENDLYQIMCNSNNSFAAFTKFLYTFLTRHIGNHRINIIEDNDKLFFYDITNLYVFNAALQKSRAIGYSVTFEPHLYMSCLTDPFNRYATLYSKLANNPEPAFTSEEIKYHIDLANCLFADNKALIDDAYTDVHPKLVRINELTTKKD